MAAKSNPRMMATVNPRKMAKTISYGKPTKAATDKLKLASIELRTSSMKPKLKLRTMATVKLMKSILNKHRIRHLNLCATTGTVNNNSKHIKLLRTAEHKETLVEAQ